MSWFKLTGATRGAPPKPRAYHTWVPPAAAFVRPGTGGQAQAVPLLPEVVCVWVQGCFNMRLVWWYLGRSVQKGKQRLCRWPAADVIAVGSVMAHQSWLFPSCCTSMAAILRSCCLLALQLPFWCSAAALQRAFDHSSTHSQAIPSQVVMQRVQGHPDGQQGGCHGWPQQQVSLVPQGGGASCTLHSRLAPPA